MHNRHESIPERQYRLGVCDSRDIFASFEFWCLVENCRRFCIDDFEICQIVQDLFIIRPLCHTSYYHIYLPRMPKDMVFSSSSSASVAFIFSVEKSPVGRSLTMVHLPPEHVTGKEYIRPSAMP